MNQSDNERKSIYAIKPDGASDIASQKNFNLKNYEPSAEAKKKAMIRIVTDTNKDTNF